MQCKIFFSFLLLVMAFGSIEAQEKKLLVRVAKLVIDSIQLGAYINVLQIHAETAVKLEPGVLSLYAIYEKGNPTHITVFEIYASDDAYKSHLLTPHFLKYKTGTKEMVKSLELIDGIPFALETKYKITN